MPVLAEDPPRLQRLVEFLTAQPGWGNNWQPIASPVDQMPDNEAELLYQIYDAINGNVGKFAVSGTFDVGTIAMPTMELWDSIKVLNIPMFVFETDIGNLLLQVSLLTSGRIVVIDDSLESRFRRELANELDRPGSSYSDIDAIRPLLDNQLIDFQPNIGRKMHIVGSRMRLSGAEIHFLKWAIFK